MKYEEPKIKPTKEALEVASKLLTDPMLLGWIERAFDKDLGIVREKPLKLYTFLGVLSALIKMPKMQQMIQLRGSSRSGKTHIANAICSLFRIVKTGDWTPAYFRYIDNELFENPEAPELERKLKVDILYIQEFKELDKEGSSLRLMAAEDGGYEVKIVVAGDREASEPELRRTHIEKKHIPPMAVITTTTRFDVDEQFSNRMHIVNTDESPEQTSAILKRLVSDEYKQFFKAIGSIKPTLSREVIQGLIELLRERGDILISSTAPAVIGELFPLHRLTARSDYLKIANILRMVVFLYQDQRPYMTIKGPNIGEKRVVFMLPQDVYYTLEIVHDALLTMNTGLEQREREMIPALWELRNATQVINAKTGEQHAGAFTRRQVRKYLGHYSLKTIKDRLDSMVDKGILEKVKSAGADIWMLAIDEDELANIKKLTESLKFRATIVPTIVAEVKAYFAMLEKYIPGINIKAISSEAFIVKPIPEWFDNEYDGPVKDSGFGSFNVQLHKDIVSAEHVGVVDLYDLTIKVWDESRLWLGGITKGESSEVYPDRLAKWYYKKYGDKKKVKMGLLVT